MLHAVIMAGGSGTRFWPLSRRSRPKHLLPLTGAQTLVQQTAARVAPLVAPDRTWVITGADHADELRAQLPDLPDESIITEPCGRDTAVCIGLAATVLLQKDPDALMAVLPADHAIRPDTEFRQSIEAAAALVRDEPSRLVTFGIRPDRPATGYGYIERGRPLPGPSDLRIFAVQSFREKPARELAERFLATGDYYWNSGIFVWFARTVLAELRQSKASIYDGLARIGEAWRTPGRAAVLECEYANMQRISIDHAVMERARSAVVVEANYEWDDLGSWQAIERSHAGSSDDNTVLGMHCGLDTHDSIVVTDPEHLVATLGVEHLVIVQSGNATLVADKRQEESVKRLVELMRERGLDRYL